MIYTITTINIHPANDFRSRVVGYFNNFEQANNAVINNLGDINEHGWYNYVVVEEVNEGLYPLTDNRWIYKFDYITKQYAILNLEEDKIAENYFLETIGFSMG